jgi:hypothetical protein
MRHLSKMFVVAVGLLAVIVLSSSLYANDMLGTFTLSHPTQWNSTMLAPGDYTFRIARTQSNANLLMVRGEKQTFNWLIYPESACSTCQHGSLNLEVRGDDRMVTSLELTGFHVDFKSHESAKEREKQLGKVRAHSEQVAVKVNPN